MKIFTLPIGICSEMVNRLAKILFFLLLFIPFFFPKNTFAAITVQITSYKQSISVGETFPVTVSVSGLNNGQSCKFKVGVSPEGSSAYGSGRILSGDACISYSSSWDVAPSFTAFADPFVVNLTAKTTDATTGQKKLRVRVCFSDSCSDAVSSSDVSLSAIESTSPDTEDPPENTTQPQDPEPPSCPSGISLSEFMAYPNTDQQEWVEIYNGNETAVNLKDWYIDDIEGGTTPTPFSAGIEGRSYWAIYLTDNKFNNTGGDSVRLLCPDKSLIDQYSYVTLAKDRSWARDSSKNWQETTTPTPGGVNKITKPIIVVKEETKVATSIASDNEVFAETQSAGSSAVLGESNENTETEGDILPEAASDFRPEKPPIWRVKGKVEATASQKIEEASSEASRSAGKDFSKGLISGGALLSLGSLFYIVLTKFKQIPKN
jgi:hypothetical protein